MCKRKEGIVAQITMLCKSVMYIGAASALFMVAKVLSQHSEIIEVVL